MIFSPKYKGMERLVYFLAPVADRNDRGCFYLDESGEGQPELLFRIRRITIVCGNGWSNGLWRHVGWPGGCCFLVSVIKHECPVEKRVEARIDRC